MADAASGPQSGFALHHLRQQLIRMQASFHQELGLAGADKLDGLFGSGLAMRHIDDLGAAEVERKRLRHCGDLVLGTDEDGSDQPGLARLEGASQRGFVARMRNGCREGRKLFAAAIRRSYFSWRRKADADEFSFMARSFPRQRLGRRRAPTKSRSSAQIARMGDAVSPRLATAAAAARFPVRR